MTAAELKTENASTGNRSAVLSAALAYFQDQPTFKDVERRVVSDLTNTDKAMNDGFWIDVWPSIDKPPRAYIVETFKSLVRDLVS